MSFRDEMRKLADKNREAPIRETVLDVERAIRARATTGFDSLRWNLGGTIQDHHEKRLIEILKDELDLSVTVNYEDGDQREYRARQRYLTISWA